MAIKPLLNLFTYIETSAPFYGRLIQEINLNKCTKIDGLKKMLHNDVIIVKSYFSEITAKINILKIFSTSKKLFHNSRIKALKL